MKPCMCLSHFKNSFAREQQYLIVLPLNLRSCRLKATQVKTYSTYININAILEPTLYRLIVHLPISHLNCFV